jgi:hypothetical protein
MELSSFASNAQSLVPLRSRIWRRMVQVRSSLGVVDVLVFSFIICFGALQFFFPERAPDFQTDDVFYADAGRSIIQHGYYGINGQLEVNQPPGLPAFLALLCLSGAGTHTSFLRSMAIFDMLGFLVTYELLRRQTSRVVAASICLLLVSSKIYFLLSTQWVFPSFPYFFTSTCALLAARRFERSTASVSRVAWGVLLTLLIVASLMFASAAMAFLAAILISTASLFFRNRPRGFARLKLYFVVFIVAAAVQVIWMHRKGAPPEWPVPGYPQSYVSQLKVKSGNQPELGMATLGDIPSRMLRHAADDSVLLSQTLFRHWIDVAWMSLLVTGPIALILLGWGSSVWRTGGTIQDWYFVVYQAIYLLWPWKTEARFFLPVAALACFYMWRGGIALITLARHRPRLLGLVWYPVGVILAVSSWFWMQGAWIGSQMTHAGLQDETSFLIWIVSAILCVRMIWGESSWQGVVRVSLKSLSQPIRLLNISPLQIIQFLCLATVGALTFIGLGSQLEIARANRDLNSPANRIQPDVLAGEWIKAHTQEDAVVMARHLPISFHYSARKTIWFPPSSDPDLLMEGINKHKINYAIVVAREHSYYLPPEEDCIAALLAAYPSAVELVYQGTGFRIFRMVPYTARSLPTNAGTSP